MNYNNYLKVKNLLLDNSVRIAAVSFLTYMVYPELKKFKYDLTEPSSFPQSVEIKRVKSHLKSKVVKNLEDQFDQVGYEYHDEPGFKWVNNALWTPEYFFNLENKYEFTDQAAKDLVHATFQVKNMCLEAVDFVIDHPELLSTAFNIPEVLHPWVIHSWKNKKRDLITRFDFLHNDQEGFKFIEANADTPTLLIDAALAQQLWSEQSNNKTFNIISPALKEAWVQSVQKEGCNNLTGYSYGVDKPNRFQEKEDRCNARYLINCASEVFNQENTYLKDIEKIDDQFYNAAKPLEEGDKSKGKSCIWKLYPYEWMAYESCGKYFYKDPSTDEESIHMLEPAWKLLMANKAILPILWALYPNNQYLLPSYFMYKSPDNDQTQQYLDIKDCVGKRVFGREGKTVSLGSKYRGSSEKFYIDCIKKGDTKFDEEEMTDIPHYQNDVNGIPIFQKYFQSTKFKGRSNTIGSWLIYGLPSGIGIREDIQDIVNSASSFVPHSIENGSNLGNLSENQFRYSATKNQMKLRENLYGKQNKIEEIYKNTGHRNQEIKIDSSAQQLNQKDKDKAFFDIQDQLRIAQQYQPQHINRYRSSGRNGGGGGGSGVYQTGSTSHSNSQSTTAKAGKSFSSRFKTGSAGKGFSAGS